jgi:hypothetical protein
MKFLNVLISSVSFFVVLASGSAFAEDAKCLQLPEAMANVMDLPDSATIRQYITDIRFPEGGESTEYRKKIVSAMLMSVRDQAKSEISIVPRKVSQDGCKSVTVTNRSGGTETLNIKEFTPRSLVLDATAQKADLIIELPSIAESHQLGLGSRLEIEMPVGPSFENEKHKVEFMSFLDWSNPLPGGEVVSLHFLRMVSNDVKLDEVTTILDANRTEKDSKLVPVPMTLYRKIGKAMSR